MAVRDKPLDKEQIASIGLLAMLAIGALLLIGVLSFVFSHLAVVIMVIAAVIGISWLGSVWLSDS